MVFGKRMAVEFFLVILTGASFATSLNACPDQSQRKLRQTAFCGTSSLYYICLNNTENDNVREICANKTDFAGVGQKYVWTGNYRNVDCPSNRYQPHNLYRSDSHECQFLKSTCNELGQILHSNGSTKSDVSCRCDESKGFEFVQPIKNRYCVPSIEDCSCYLKPCTGDLCTRNTETITKSDKFLTSSFIDKPSLKINGRGYAARIIVSSIFSTLVIGFFCTVCLVCRKPTWFYEEVNLRDGDRVCVFPIHESKKLHRTTVGQGNTIVGCIGRTFIVKRIKPGKVIEVEDNGITYSFSHDDLKKVNDYKVGETIKVLDEIKTVKQIQEANNKEWVDGMEEVCGKVGMVVKIHIRDFVLVEFGHLPLLYHPACLIPAPDGETDELTRDFLHNMPPLMKSILPKYDGEMRVKDRVCVFLSMEELEELQRENWNNDMAAYIGDIGVVKRIESDFIEVEYGGYPYKFKQNALRKVFDIKAGNTVKVLEDPQIVQRLQKIHGGWDSNMKEACGKVGQVLEIDKDDDVVVQFGQQKWVYSPACLIPATGENVDQILRKDDVDILSTFRDLISPAEVDKEPDHDHKQEEDIKSTSSKESKDVFDVEDRVCVIVSSEDLEKIQRKKDAWEKGMAKYIGRIGKVTKVESEVIEVNYEGITYKFLKEVLKKMYDIKVGDLVKVEKEVKTVKRLQEVFGGWVDDMTWACGKVGKVIQVHRGGAVVRFKDLRWGYHQACLIPAPGQKVDNVAPGLGANQAGFAEKLEKFLPKVMEMGRQLGIVGPEQMIHAACRQGDLALVEKIVEMKEDVVNFVVGDLTPLMVACHEGHQKIVDFLLSKGADVNTVTSEKLGVVLSAILGNKEELAKYLIEKGADVTVKDKFGRTLAHQACLNGMPELLEALLKNGCDLNIQDNEGDTPLHKCIAQGDDKIIGILLDHPSINLRIRNKRGFQPLMWAALRDHAFAVKRLLKRDIELTKLLMPDGKSALHIAAINDHRDVASCLIREGKADVNLKDEDSVTALDLACMEAYHRMAKLLLQNNADPNIQDDKGNAALHFAIGGPASAKDFVGLGLPGMKHAKQPKSKIKRFKTACLLVGNKSNIHLKNKMGNKALDECRSQWIRNSLTCFISKLDQRKRDDVDVNDAYFLDKLIEEVLKNEAAGAKKEKEEETDNIPCPVQ